MAAHRKLSDTHTIISELQPALKEKKLVLFLDYDGTLAELTTSPDDTFMTTHMTKVLGEVSRLEDVVVVAITGRKTEDIKNRLALTNIIYSGNHGLEVCLNGKGTTYTLGDEELKVLRKSVQNVIDELREKKLGKECGGNIEDKETAMTWHFFDVPESEEEEIVKKASEIVERNGFPVFRGHGCIEVRHPKITKGNAMKKILYEKFGENWHEKYCAIFIGDSSSDEEGFAALCSDPEFRSDRVIFIKIQQDGLMATAGRYIFHGPDDVYALLCALKDFYQK